MCLSPEVDLAAAIVTGVIAVDTLRRNRNPDALAIAGIPAIFAVHNVASALMWWGLLGDVGGCVAVPAQFLYVLIAFVLWPVYIPFALRKMESRGIRRALLSGVLVLGAVNSGWHLWRIARGDMTAFPHEHYVSFHFPSDPLFVGPLYAVATCGATLLSSHRELVLWGVVNIVAVTAISAWAAHGLPSIWCLWAAITSGYINWFIRGHSLRFHGAVPA